MANKRMKKYLKQEFGRRCMLCCEELYDSEMTYHHIKPKSVGGLTTKENGAILCEQCQDRIHKYDFLTEEYFDLTLKIINNKIKFLEQG